MHGRRGLPCGWSISPLPSNIYLDPLDHLMAGQGVEMVRDADELVILCRSAADARRALERMTEWTDEAGLTLHPTKTRIVDANQEGFDFLGYHYERGKHWPRDKSVKRFRAAVRSKTPRKHGRCLEDIIGDVNWTTRGWFAYFKHTVRQRVPQPGRLDSATLAADSAQASQEAPPQRARNGALSLAQRVLCRAGAVQHGDSLCTDPSIRGAVNHRPESRMREIRQSGSEGGETGQPVFPTSIRDRRNGF